MQYFIYEEDMSVVKKFLSGIWKNLPFVHVWYGKNNLFYWIIDWIILYIIIPVLVGIVMSLVLFPVYEIIGAIVPELIFPIVVVIFAVVIAYGIIVGPVYFYKSGRKISKIKYEQERRVN